NLTIVIDKEGGVTIDDCEMLHKAIDAPLDELDPIENSYTLNVSSPGLDRPLKLDWDYKRNLGKKISVKLYKPFLGKKTFQGVLASFDETSFVLDAGGKQITFLKKDTAVVLPVIEF
ncbi:MAG: ribosome maturation factor RimP, partial [Candidatus Fimimonas sp.]